MGFGDCVKVERSLNVELERQNLLETLFPTCSHYLLI